MNSFILVLEVMITKFNRRVHAHLTTLRATSSLTVFTSKEKSWFNRVGRNWTYVSTSTAWRDCKDKGQAWLIHVYKSLKMSTGSYVEINLSDILVHVYIHNHLTKVNKKIPYLSYIHLITIKFSLLNIAINTFVNYISSFIIKNTFVTFSWFIHAIICFFLFQSFHW